MVMFQSVENFFSNIKVCESASKRNRSQCNFISIFIKCLICVFLLETRLIANIYSFCCCLNNIERQNILGRMHIFTDHKHFVIGINIKTLKGEILMVHRYTNKESVMFNL